MDYNRLRKIAMDRISRLEKAGFTVSFRPARKRDLKNERDLARETRRLEKWLSQERNTLKGARKARAERLEKKRTAERRRYEERRKSEGKTYKPRKPEIKKQTAPAAPAAVTSESSTAPAGTGKTVDEQVEDLLLGLTGGPEDKDLLKKYVALKNLLSGLRKYNVNVPDINALMLWGSYIEERKEDSEKDFYLFPIWTDQLYSGLDREKGEKVSADDIKELEADFNKWRTENGELAAEYASQIAQAEKGLVRYDSESVNDMWELYTQLK